MPLFDRTYLKECEYHDSGTCIKSSCFGYPCSKKLWVDEDNNNNACCDLAGYKPKEK